MTNLAESGRLRVASLRHVVLQLYPYPADLPTPLQLGHAKRAVPIMRNVFSDRTRARARASRQCPYVSSGLWVGCSTGGGPTECGGEGCSLGRNPYRRKRFEHGHFEKWGSVGFRKSCEQQSPAAMLMKL